MRDPVQVQQELDAAQADLEVKVGQLKQLFAEKLETPKKILHSVEHPITFIRKHAVVAAVVGVGLVLLIWRRRARAHMRA